MLKRRYTTLILALMLVSIVTATGVYYYRKPSRKIYAGFWRRGQEALSPEYEINLTRQMASSIPSASPASIWTVGLVAIQKGTCMLSFPSNQTYPYMGFETRDINEDYLTAFDDNGIRVWLEVEPGFADIDQLIDLVLKRYRQHPSVQGFAVDLEWRWDLPNTEAVPVTDEEADKWLKRIKSYNNDYELLLIHWLPEFAPPAAREGMALVDDAQGFEDLDSLVREFKSWGETFSQTEVGYIFGYQRDLEWLSKMENPPKEIGLALVQNIPNCGLIFWSQETILEVFPPS